MVAVSQDNGLLNSILRREKDMKKKMSLNQEIYLPEYFSDTFARTFEKESERRILYWDEDSVSGDVEIVEGKMLNGNQSKEQLAK